MPRQQTATQYHNRTVNPHIVLYGYEIRHSRNLRITGMSHAGGVREHDAEEDISA
jgi:hypothetical protein